MTPREAERRHQQSDSDQAANLDDDRVLSFAQWCALNGFSEATGRRMISLMGARFVTQISERRIGITTGDNRRWQASRARGMAS